MTEDDLVTTLAKAINGPHQPVPPTSRWSLEQLREVLWGRLPRQEQAARCEEARAVLREIFALTNDRPLDDGLRTSIDGALEIVRKHDPGMVGLIHNLCRLSEYLHANAAAQAIETRRAETGTGSVHESAVAESEAPNV